MIFLFVLFRKLALTNKLRKKYIFNIWTIVIGFCSAFLYNTQDHTLGMFFAFPVRLCGQAFSFSNIFIYINLSLSEVYMYIYLFIFVEFNCYLFKCVFDFADSSKWCRMEWIAYPNKTEHSTWILRPQRILTILRRRRRPPKRAKRISSSTTFLKLWRRKRFVHCSHQSGKSKVVN